MDEPLRETAEIVTRRAGRTYQIAVASMKDLVGRTPVVPEDRSVFVSYRCCRCRQSTGIRSEENIDAILCEESGNVLSSIAEPALIVVVDDSHSVRVSVGNADAALRVHVGLPKPYPIEGLSSLEGMPPGQRDRKPNCDLFHMTHSFQ